MSAWGRSRSPPEAVEAAAAMAAAISDWESIPAEEECGTEAVAAAFMADANRYCKNRQTRFKIKFKEIMLESNFQLRVPFLSFERRDLFTSQRIAVT